MEACLCGLPGRGGRRADPCRAPLQQCGHHCLSSNRWHGPCSPLRCSFFEDGPRLEPLTGDWGTTGVSFPALDMRRLAFHPALPVAYALAEAPPVLYRLDVDPATGLLAQPDWADPAVVAARTALTVPPGSEAHCQAAEVAMTRDGRFLYASTRCKASASSVAIFRLDPATGAPSLVAVETAGGALSSPRYIELTPDERFLLAANQGSGTVAALARDAATGRLALVSTVNTTSVNVTQVGVGGLSQGRLTTGLG